MSDDAYAVVINGRTYVEMYAAQSLVRQARSEARDNALEEAAIVAEDNAPVCQDMEGTIIAERCDAIAAAIRKLKEKT